MGFETYVPQRGRSSKKPTIRILKNGDLSISPTVYEWFKGADHVELMFDSRRKKIGLKPRRNRTRVSYKLRKSPQGGANRYVSGRQFLANYGINVRKTKSYDAKWNTNQKVVEFSVV